jgi:2-oxoisovalerate dehydrogenase E2 component (dihydrolipoyl transacylase)
MERVFNLPDLGEGLTDGEVIRWLVAEGDQVTLNQPLVEVETAKAAVELPSPWAGKVTRLHAGEGQAVDVGAPIVTVEVAGAEPGLAPGDVPSVLGESQVESQPTLVGPGPRGEGRRRRIVPAEPAGSSEPAGTSEPAVNGHQPAPTAIEAAPEVTRDRPKATPPVRKYARDRGVDLSLLTGTGRDGRITRSDVDAALAPEPAVTPAAPAARERGEQRTPVRGTRRAIAAAMVASVSEIPHVTEFLTIDATAVLALRDRLRALPAVTEAGLKVTPLAVIAKAVATAARRFPLLNASWRALPGGEAEIVTRDWVHLGIATDTAGGLVVPVVRDADRLGILELAGEITRLTTLARDRKASPADLSGSTITVTNIGGFGVESGTPIINRPECAIVATGQIAERPWVVDGQLAVRSVMTISVSFDHRIVDGAEAARFLTTLRDLLEDPALLAAF